jgi:hypothetical protein
MPCGKRFLPQKVVPCGDGASFRGFWGAGHDVVFLKIKKQKFGQTQLPQIITAGIGRIFQTFVPERSSFAIGQ